MKHKHIKTAILSILAFLLILAITSCINLNKVAEFVKQHPESKQTLCDPCLPGKSKTDTVIKTETITITEDNSSWVQFLHSLDSMNCQSVIDSLKKIKHVNSVKYITKTVTIHDSIPYIDNLAIQKAVSDRAAIDAVELEKVKAKAISPAWKWILFICFGIILALVCILLFLRWAKKL